jgi:TolB-like protein/DNA-binding SARP family transcriptional activator
MLGGLSIATEGGPLTGRAVQRRRLALLALLAVARDRGMSRVKLIAYLWPAADEEIGRHYLSDSVYRINSALGGEAIIAAGDDLRLDPQRLPSDLAEFQDAAAAGDHERAAALYGGAFLDGFFLSDAPELERWIEDERTRVAAAFGRTLEALATTAAQRGDRTAAVGWWQRLAAHDPYNSRIALSLMQALSDAGERAAAIQHARVHEALLAGELELGADPAVAEFAERLRKEKCEGVAVLRTPVRPPDSDGASRTEVVARPEAGAQPAPSPRSPGIRWGRWPGLRWVFASAAAATLIALWLRGGAHADRAPAPSGPLRSIAVLPFANVSVEPENEYFSDGMTEELITTLGTVDGLSVVSRTSAFVYKHRSVDVREIGKTLGVDAVVEGSVRKSGRRLRITAQLVSTSNGYRLWSDAYDREVEDAFALPEEIARAIVTRMRGRLAGAAAVADRSTRDSDAYDLYLRGRYAWHQRTREGLTEAIEHFRRSVERAPAYARAHAGLGDAYAVSAFYDYLAPGDAYPKAEAAARRALEIDPALAAPHATLGYISTYYHLDWVRAEAEFRRALAIDPNYSTAHQWYANLLTVAARFDEAEREMRLAQEADPLALIANAALGWSFYYAGEYSAALEQCRRTLALEPNYGLAHLWGGWALDALGQLRDARQWIDRAVELSPQSDVARLGLARVLALSGVPAQRDSARMIVREIETRAGRGAYVPSYEMAKAHLALGSRDQALRWLARAIEERSHSRAFLRVDPQLDLIRGDARYERLVERAFGNTAAATPGG